MDGLNIIKATIIEGSFIGTFANFLPFEATLFARVKAADSLIFLALLSDTYLKTLKSWFLISEVIYISQSHSE